MVTEIKCFKDLMSLDLGDVSFDISKDIEIEVSDYTSLIYSIADSQLYAYNYDVNECEEYKIPISEDDNEYPFNITIDDVQEALKIITKDLQEGLVKI